MRKINYATFLKENVDFSNKKLVGNKKEVKAGKAAFAASELGVTIHAHDGTALQFTHFGPGKIGVQEWNMDPHTKELRGWRGRVKVMDAGEAFKLAGNRAIPDHKWKVQDFFKELERLPYQEYVNNLRKLDQAP